MTARLVRGVPREHRHAAAELYWQAFGGKLGPVMGPEPQALRFLDRALRPDHAVTALSEDGRLLGIAGFKTAQGAFAGGTAADLQAVYGWLGGLWRAFLLRLLSSEVDNDRFLIDGICVAREARSRGIGSQLVSALCDEARTRGYAEIRLDVIDTNWRARQLYERLGFRAVSEQNLGPLRLVFGFRSATVMVRRLD